MEPRDEENGRRVEHDAASTRWLWALTTACSDIPTICADCPPIPEGLEWIVYNTANSGLPSDSILGLAVDDQGNIWGGCWNGTGLTKFDGETWTVYDTGNSGLPHNGFVRVAIDPQGNMWIGTYGGGLAVYREGGVK